MEIALSLSGGGYRAAVYHIGVLSYLDSIKMSEDETLLDCVNILSSVSGGSLTSLWYVLKRCDGINTTESLCDLYNTIINSDIEKELYEDFQKGSTEGNTMIMQLSLVYDRLFFKGEKYGTILNKIQDDNFNIHHYAVCATDFSNGRPFHFFASRSIDVNNNQINPFKIGNKDNSIDIRVAHETYLSDLMAASSCFPGLFEPFTFPDDFRFENRKVAEALSKDSFSLMDGGIVDNQGVEAISKLDGFYKKYNNNIELIMVSDVAKANPKKFERSKSKVSDGDVQLIPFMLKKAPWFIAYYKCILFVSTILFIISPFGVYKSDGLWLILSSFLTGFMGCISLIYIIALCKLPYYYSKVKEEIKKKYSKELTFDFNESFIWNIKTNSILDFNKNRIKSLMLMVNDVMMGQIRRHKLKQAFGGKYECRTILNAIYALTSAGTWKQYKKTEIESFLRPTDKILKISNRVANINTRLCFTKEQLDSGIPKDLVVCGQYTTCWNLLMSINRIKRLPESDRNETQRKLVQIESLLREDWNNFKNSPDFKSII